MIPDREGLRVFESVSRVLDGFVLGCEGLCFVLLEDV